MPNGSILIIDDNREHLRILRNILKAQGYAVRLAPDGHLGLNSARTMPPDVLLLDIAMADMDGYEVCRQLKRDDRTYDVPVIFVSALDETMDKVKAFAAGGVDYITKPFQAEEVLARVATHLALRRTQRQFAQQNRLLQREIAERRRAEERLQRVERALRALSQCNESMLRASSEMELLQGVCQSIVDKGIYRLAWVGFLEHEPIKRVRPVAQAGYEDGYLQTLDIRWDDSERGQGPTGQAIRMGLPRIIADIPGNPSYALWRDEALQRGYNSSIALPLICEGETLGTLNVYSSEVGAFDAEEVALLLRLADNLAYGINTLRNRAAREVVESRLYAHHQQLQLLSRRLVEVQENERYTIARELHDEVGQILTGLKLSLEMVTRGADEASIPRLEHARELVNELMQRVRDMSMHLRPPMLDDLGLLPALLWHFERYTAQTGIQVECKHSGLENQRFPPDIEITTYRAIQEALTNVARHAAVVQTVVRLWVNHNHLGMQIEDHGKGFDAETTMMHPASSGLLGMRERVRLLGGQFQIDAAPGAGCCLTIELPLNEDNQQQPVVPPLPCASSSVGEPRR